MPTPTQMIMKKLNKKINKKINKALGKAWLSMGMLALGLIMLKSCSGMGDLFSISSGSLQKLPNSMSMGAYEALLAQSRVISVADADTLTLLGRDENEYKIRLQGIDAPERQQAYGARCQEKIAGLLTQQFVDVEAYKRDRYQRLVAKVIWQGQDVALETIRLGCGWHYKAYADEQSWSDQRAYAKAERHARRNKLGLWRDANPEAPWDYRRR